MGTSKLLVCFLVSLVLLPEVQSQSPCAEKNKIYVENSFPLLNLEACEGVCMRSDACTFYTWNSNNCGIRTYSPNALVKGDQKQTVATKALDFIPITGQVYVGAAVGIPGGNSQICQESCQGNDDCQSWTWNAVGSFNPEVCVHNYGKTKRILAVSAVSKIESGPKYCRRIEGEPGWRKVYSHNTAGGLFANKDEAKRKNIDNEDASLFSILYDLELFRNSDGVFHFKLCYPEMKGCNEWNQSSNPLTESTITGYVGIEVPFNKRGDSQAFRGIGLSVQGVNLIDDYPSSGLWFNSIGTLANYGTGTVPGPRGSAIEQVKIKVMYVFL